MLALCLHNNKRYNVLPAKELEPYPALETVIWGAYTGTVATVIVVGLEYAVLILNRRISGVRDALMVLHEPGVPTGVGEAG